ncbi:hypothetical protein TKK_0001499 [Trichogramma kaykai]
MSEEQRTTSGKKQFTFEEVKKASEDRKRTVFVIKNNVYDVTEFLNEHPGGEEILMDHGGKDATEDFIDVGHSTDALELMKKYHLGEIVESERRPVVDKESWATGDQFGKRKGDESESSSPVTMIVVAVIAVLVFLLYFYK